MEIEVGGQIQGISLGSFLQIVHMDKTSCTLKIYSNDDVGYLYLQDGALIASEAGEISGLDAAYEILSWNKTVIIIDSAPAPERSINTPLMSILMEGLRRKDERNAEIGDIEDARKEIEVDFDPETYVSKDDEIASQFVVKPGDNTPQPADSDAIELDYGDSPPPQPEPEPEPEPEKSEPKDDSGVKGQDRALPEKKQPTSPPDAKIKKPVQEPDEAVDEIEFEGEDAILPEKTIKGKLKRLFLISVILVAATFAGLQFYRVSLLKKHYEGMISQIKTKTDLQAIKNNLENFINSRDDGDRYLTKAVELMNELTQLMNVDQKVKALTVDENYKKTATDLYRQYKKDSNEKVFHDYIAKQMRLIPARVERFDFKRLGVITTAPRNVRMKMYKQFLDDYPKSKNRQAVKNMIAAVGDEVYVEVKRNLRICNKTGNWDTCLKIAERFIRDFNEDARLDSIKELRQELQEKTEFADLKFRSGAVSFEAAREMYISYLKKNPETSLKKKIRTEISHLNRKIDFQSKWDETYKFCKNKAVPLSQRIREINDYIDRDYSGLFEKESSKLLAELKAEEKGLKKKKFRLKKEKAEKERLARIEAEKEKIAKEKEDARLKELKRRQHEKRLKEESKRMKRLLAEAGSRFIVNSDRTVKDTQTGLTWSIIDSSIETGECMTFKQAKKFVENMRTGGYRDWRLPGTGELAVLYNRKPYYPSSGAQWYWTAETIDEAQIGGGKSAIFYPDQKDVFKKIYLEFSNCGYVHAVRP